MAENRSVIIRVRAETGDFTAKMAALGKSVSATSREMTSAEKHAVKFRQGLTSVGDAAGKIGLVAGAGLAAVVATTANFEQAMSKVQAATHETASGMDALREAAIQAGADTAFSASEAAAGIESLAKAGVGTREILGGGLAGALNLAAAGQMEVAEAAEAAAGAMAQFNLDGSQVPHIADLLAAGAGKAQGEVSDMVYALKQGGLVAAQTGLTLEETVGTLAAFAEQSLLGSDAGTSFKTMLASLTPNTAKAAKAMEQYGINAFDARGNFVGMVELARQLEEGLGNLSAEQRMATLETIFGSDAVRAASIVYDQGAEGIQKWINKANDQAYAAETAAIKLDNLKGDWEAFTGSLETALIGAGEGSQGMLRGLVQGATDAVNAFNDLPPALKNVSSGMLAITAISGGGLWFGAKMVTGIANTRAALEDLGPVGIKAAGALGKVGKAAGIAGAAFAGFVAADAISRIGDDAVPGIEELTTKLLDLADAGVAAKIGADFDDLGTSIDRLTDKNWSQTINDNLSGMLGGLGSGRALREARADIDGLDAALAQLASGGHADIAADALDNLIAAQGLTATEAEQLRSILPQYGDALAGIENDAKLAGDSSWAAAHGIEAVGEAADDAETPVDRLGQALEDLEAIIEGRQSFRDYEQAIDDFADRLAERQDLIKDLKEAQRELNQAETPAERKAARESIAAIKEELADYALTLDTGEQAGRDWQESLEALALGALSTATQLTGLDQRKYLRKARKDFVDAAMDLGETRREAQRLWEELTQLEEVDPTITVTYKTKGLNSLRNQQKLYGDAYADGGHVLGPGTGTSDDIPAWLSNGEYVIKAAAVAKYGTAMFDSLNTMRFAEGGMVRSDAYRGLAHQTTNHYYAQGGAVASSSGMGIDYDRLAAAMLNARPLYGPVTVVGDNSFRRTLEDDARTAALGGANFT